MLNHRLALLGLLASLFLSLSLPVEALGQGLVLPGAGPINLSMAGASTASAVDVGGSYWNPAIISALPRSEMLLSSQFLLPSIHLDSSLPAGSVGGFYPPTNRYGTSRSDGGVGAVPTAIISFRLSDDSPWTFAMGSQYLAGGGVNFPGSSANPIVSPHDPPRSFGFGPIYSNAAIGLSSIIASRRVTDRLAIAAGPLIAIESVSLNPASFAAPVNGILKGGYPTFPAGFQSRPFWGGGFQLGLFYELNENWNLGFSYKSPIWQERWGYNSTTATGAPNRIGIQASLPEIISWGVAYKGFERTIIDVDLRYMDYANTDLFGTAAPPKGNGLGWSSVFAVAIGGQYQLTDRLSLRAGYLFNTDPVPSGKTLLNVELPAITQHMLAFGTSYKVTDDITFSLAYTHQFRNTMSGSILQFTGVSVREDVQIDSIIAGLTVQFGGKRKAHPATCDPVAAAPMPVPASDLARPCPCPLYPSAVGAAVRNASLVRCRRNGPTTRDGKVDVARQAWKPIVRTALAWGLALGLGLSGGGCAFGPRVLEKTHGRYNEAIRRVDEEQLLRNLVRMRYNETPLDLNVSSIAAQYELNGGAEARPFFAAPNPSSHDVFHSFTRVLPDATVSGANRPTITLVPGDNGDAVQRFLTPISADTLIFLSQTSWPVSTVLRLWVERINGVPNASSASGPPRGNVPDFERFQRAAYLTQTFRDRKLGTIHEENREVEVGGPLPASAVTAAATVDAAKNGMEYRPRGDGTTWALLRKEPRLVVEFKQAALGDPDVDELLRLLNVQPGRLRYDVVLAPGIIADPLLIPTPLSLDLKLSTRSTAQVFFYLANGVEVPCEHLASGVARQAVGPDGVPFDSRAVTAGLFTAHAVKGHHPPATAFVAVKYRDYWYYIDDRDQASKATFALVLQLSRLDFARQQPAAPFLTLPIGR